MRAQISLEMVEESIAQHLLIETIEGAHARFLSALDTSSAETTYLLMIGRLGVHPLSSRLRSFHGGGSGYPSRTRSAPSHGGPPNFPLSHAPAATRR